MQHNSDVPDPEAQGPTLRKPLPYGQACAGCAKAKCKCFRAEASAGSPCQRCQRLGRTCQPSQATRKRGGGRPPNRTAQIEEKLESLVTLLKSQAPPAADTNATSAVPVTLGPTPMSLSTEANINTSSSMQPPFFHSNDAHDFTADTSPASDPLCGSTPSGSTSYSNLADIDPLQAEENLQLFRTTYLPAFPAIYIPLTTTQVPVDEVTLIGPEKLTLKTSAAQLRLQKPYLWLAIQSICCRPFSSRAVLQETLRRMFAERVVVQFEYSMDLLLGHLVFAMWGTLTNRGKQAFHMSAAMTAALAQDLKLDRSPGPEESGFVAFAYGLNTPSAAMASRDGQQSARKERTNEERRAVLACFCLCSSTFHKLGTPPMRWTPHMDECLRQLADQPECENDEILVVLTKCSKILDDIFGFSICGFGDREAYGRVHNRLPSTIPIKALRGILDEVRSQIRPHLLEKRVVKFWLLLIEVLIFDLALQHPGSSPSTNLNFARAEFLQSCLFAINHFFDNFGSFKPREYIGLHVHYWLYFMRCTRIVYRLLLVEDPAWDTNAIRESVDLMAALQRGVDICRAVQADAGLDTSGKEGHGLVATNLERVKSIWTKALEQAGTFSTAAGAEDGISPGTFQPVLSDDLYSFDLYPDAWMSDVFL